MSYSYSFESATTDAELTAGFDAGRERALKQVGEDQDVRDATGEQLDLVEAAVRDLLPAVGGDRVAVAVSGHGNPGHEPRDGHANDSVSVTVQHVVAADSPAADSTPA